MSEETDNTLVGKREIGEAEGSARRKNREKMRKRERMGKLYFPCIFPLAISNQEAVNQISLDFPFKLN